MKDSKGHGSDSRGGSVGTPEGLHSARIADAVGDGGPVVIGKHPKSTPVPLHPGTIPSGKDGCDIQYQDGQFIRTAPGGGACQIADQGKTLAEVSAMGATSAKVSGGNQS